MNVFIIKIRNNISGIYDNISNALDFSYSLRNSNLINRNDKIIIQKYKINTCILLEELVVDLDYNITKKNNINYSQKSYENDNDSSSTSTNNTIYNMLDDSTINTDDIIIEEFETKDDVSINTEQKQEQIETKDDESINTEQEQLNKKLKREFIDKQNKLGQEKIKIQHEINLLKEQQKLDEEAKILYNSDLELYYKFKNLKLKTSSFVIPFMFEDKYKTFEKLELNNNLSYNNFINQYKSPKIPTSFDDLFEDPIPKYESEYYEEVEENEPFVDVNINKLYIATNQIVKQDQEIESDSEESITSSISDN